ncbi:MAG: mannonate dehydratase [Anaerolineae bacterium]|jgi:mannonate dehydratase|nr:mannonate dehydratase [Anaerolineae bacterium]
MKIALSLGRSLREMQFAQQLGLQYVVSALPADPRGYLALDDLREAREEFAAHGLAFDVIENLPTPHYYKAMFGLPGRDEQIDAVRTTLHNMGRAGISVLQYQWMLLGGLRTEYCPVGRGGARVSRFDWEVARRSPIAALDWRPGPDGLIHTPDRELTTDQVWGNLTYFLKGVVPAAEEAGVKLAAHPDDAPIPSFMGVARILSSLEGLQRLIDSVPSPCNGLGFCQGTVASMAGVDMIEAIHRFGRQGKIFFAHFRNPRGQVPVFEEVFPDEGDTDLVAAVRAYRDVGFDGVIRVDHAPAVVGDTHSERTFAYQVGYFKGLVDAIEILDAEGVN